MLHCLNPNAAGVDVGATEIYIAVPPDRDEHPVRHFLTENLQAAAAWLKSCHIETVAMESTGVYGIPLFQILEEQGFTVFLVNALDPPEGCTPTSAEEQKPKGGESAFDLRSHLHRIFGVDLTKVPGIHVLTTQTLLAEIGPDLSRFANGPAFTSWLGLMSGQPGQRRESAVGQNTQGQESSGHGTAANRAIAPHSQSYLGHFYRRMRAKLGAPKAITATAHKLARIIYHLLTTRQAYDETIFELQEQNNRWRLERKLREQARELGFEVVAAKPVGL